MFKCTRCDLSYDNIISVCRHFSRAHKLSTKTWYIESNGFEKEPTCACGCGGQVKFLDAGRGFSKYILGHAARVHNNWGHNPKALEKSHATMKQMIANNEYKPFANRSTGKLEDRGLFNMKDSVKKRIQSSLKYRGGSPLIGYCYHDIKLFAKWRHPTLMANNYVCSKCEESFGAGLDVYHDKETFLEIVNKVAKKNNWPCSTTLSLCETDITEELILLKEKIAKEVAQYHIDNKTTGVALCRKCYESLNFTRGTEENI